MINQEAIGLYLQTPDNKIKSLHRLTYNTPTHYIRHLFESLLEAQSIDFSMEPELEKRTIIIDDLSIPATDFAITRADQDRLIVSGKKGVQEYLTRLQKVKVLQPEFASLI